MFKLISKIINKDINNSATNERSVPKVSYIRPTDEDLKKALETVMENNKEALLTLRDR